MVNKYLVLFWITLLFSACEEPFSPRMNLLDLYVVYDNSLGGDEASNVPFTLQHRQKNITYSGKTDINGRIVLNSIEPGIYNLHLSTTLSIADAQTRLGYSCLLYSLNKVI